ncbi:hypothetical protein MKEN_01440500 [Mycena kentingensis (nom. inval.)]|nr:hypothetical protein MKEN_01440500 [Mycena kentingensis (nom. inval.)]
MASANPSTPLDAAGPRPSTLPSLSLQHIPKETPKISSYSKLPSSPPRSGRRPTRRVSARSLVAQPDPTVKTPAVSPTSPAFPESTISPSRKRMRRRVLSQASPSDALFPLLPARRNSADSNADAECSLDRPASSPEVSAQYLPPLCGEDDSDDDAFVETSAEWAPRYADEDEEEFEYDHDYDDEECDDDNLSVGYARPVEGSSEAHESAGDDYEDSDTEEYDYKSARLSEYLASTQAYLEPAPASENHFDFTFAAPSGAPDFPSREVILQRIGFLPLVYVPVIIPVVVPSVSTVHNGIVHERPCDDVFESDAEEYRYDCASPQDLHRAILDRSYAPDPYSYAQAPPATQALIRQLALDNPTIRPDFLTPQRFIPASSGGITSYNYPYMCPFAGCDDPILPTLNAAELHVDTCHSRIREELYACPASVCARDSKGKRYTAEQLAAHMHITHRVEPERAHSFLGCKICGEQCVGEQQYALHAAGCAPRASARRKHAEQRPTKRRRVETCQCY